MVGIVSYDPRDRRIATKYPTFHRIVLVFPHGNNLVAAEEQDASIANDELPSTFIGEHKQHFTDYVYCERGSRHIFEHYACEPQQDTRHEIAHK